MDKQSDLFSKQKEKIEAIREKGIDLYPNDFKVTHTVATIRKSVEEDPEGHTEASPLFAVAGRMMAINKFGKSSFIRFRDRTGQLQVYIRKDRVGEEAYALFKQLDVGDIIGVTGGMFTTKTGEWTLLASEFRLLAKSVRPLPEKFHGLKDPEKRYRKRYLDLIMNEDTRQLFINRSRIVQSIRNFLLAMDFLEVETPMMQPLPGGAEATPFKTHHNALGMDLFLRIAPELYLKRLVVGGFERVFEINRNFRNEGVSTRHNPEFTMLEFYWAYAVYDDLMDLTEEMFRRIALDVVGATQFPYQGEVIDVGKRWARIPLLTSLSEIGGLDATRIGERAYLIQEAAEKGITLTKTEKIGKIQTKLFDALVEPKLVQPTFVTGYPVEVSPLSRRSNQDPQLTDRFELFVGGREIANGFSELNDPMDQEERFKQQVAEREAGNQEAHPMDQDYIEALEYGMPPTAGEGIGIDRVAMLFTDSPSIREVILFPHMKHK